MRLVQAEIDAWEECICNNNCGNIAAQSDDEDRVLVDPLTHVDGWGFHSIHAGMTLGIVGYTTNALGNYLKYDMIMADQEYSDVNAFDMFSPFTDVKYEWDDVSGSCQSFVKISQGEELRGPSDELKSIHILRNSNSRTSIFMRLASLVTSPVTSPVASQMTNSRYC